MLAEGLRQGHSTMGAYYMDLMRTAALVGLDYGVTPVYTTGGPCEGLVSCEILIRKAQAFIHGVTSSIAI